MQRGSETLTLLQRLSGTLLVWILSFGLSTLAILGWGYDVEFAQAVFLLAFPMSIVGLLSVGTARRIRNEHLAGEDLRRRMWRHRVYTQMVGVVAIFVTAIWGMYQNMSVGALGG